MHVAQSTLLRHFFQPRFAAALPDNGKNQRFIAQENGIQGRVFVKFVIAADGSVTNVEVARPFDPNLDKEAVRVVKSMPKWTPGKQRGKAVRVSYTVPINFVLQ